MMAAVGGKRFGSSARLIFGALSAALVSLTLVLSGCSGDNDDEGNPGGPDVGSETTYKVTFNVNGGSGTAPAAQTVKIGSSITLPAQGDLTRSGYTFGGWNTNSSGTGTNYDNGSSYTPAKNITLYAKWNTSYIVTFNAGNGNVNPTSGTVGIDGTLASLPTPTRSGYTFDGWYTASNGGTEVTTSTVFTANSTIYARWVTGTSETYTVTFNPNGGTVSPTSGTTGAGGMLSSLPTPTREGYTFNGWYTTAAGSVKAAESRVYTSNTTIYAQWTVITYTVTFNANSGTVSPASGKTGSDKTLASLPTPTRSGYTFDGWYTSSTGGTQVTTSTTFSEDSEIYARWVTGPVATYTITFNASSGSVTPASGTTTASGTLPSLPTPTRSGYTFDGWYTSSSGGTAVTTSTVFTANATIYAQWSLETYTITFNAGYGTVSPTSATTGAGGKLSSLPTPTRTGYTFDGWYDGYDEKVTTSYVFSYSTTIYAEWTVVTNTVVFNPNGGTVTPELGTTGAGGRLSSLPTPTRPGYAFDGWYTMPTGGTKVTTSTEFSSSAVIYAQWSAVTYTVTFNPNSGAVTPTSGAVGADGKLASLPVPTRAGYAFDGWYTSSSGGTEVTTSTGFSSNATIYARWTLVPTITFNPNSGSVTPTSAAIGADGTLSSLPTPTRAGYTFDGWYTALTGGTEVTTSTVFSASATIYARWTLVTYTITFNPNEGSVTTTSGTTGAGGTLPSLPTPTRTGHTFGGWFTAETGGTQVTTSTVFSADATIYARWTTTTYTVTFNVNSGSGTTPAAQTVNAGTAITLPSQGNLSRGGYVFGGWNTQSTGTGSNYSAGASYTPTAAITLYARWTVAPGSSKDNPISTTVGYSASHSISLNGEVWFKFEGDGNPVIFETKGNVVDTYMDYVYRDNSYIGDNDNSGEGSNALYSITATTSGATYYIKIIARNQTSGSFTFVVTRPTANIRTNPITVSTGNSSSHVINSAGPHWFRFTGTGTRVFFETVSNVEELTRSMYIYAGENTSYTYSGNSNNSDGNPISFFTVSGTIYYINITTSYAGTYTFNVKTGDGNGSSRYNAKTVEVGGNYASSLTMSGAGAEKWFTFFGTGNPVTFKTTGNVVDTYMDYVYRDNSYIGDNDNGGDGFNALYRLNPSASGSTYFIKIVPRQSTQGAFNFVVTAE